MATFPSVNESYESTVKSVENTAIDTMESGEQHAYMLSDKDWYDVTLIIPVYHDQDGIKADEIEAFYDANKLDELITFNCKGYSYIGLMTSAPNIEPLSGFGVWEITVKFRAQRTGRAL